MPRFRYREEESSAGGLLFLAAGAALGLAAGIFVAQKFGGLSALTDRVRERVGRVRADDDFGADEDEIEDEDEEEFVPDEALEERVLEAFRNDPILSARAIDIGAIGTGTIELTGWVHEPDESAHAVTLARGVPGVESVVNRLDVRTERERLEATRRRRAQGDDALTESRWEGQQVGTGRRRQGTSDEPDRHADPKPELEDRWLSTDEALREAADETEGIANRRQAARKPVRGDRTGGSPIAPTGVPKADHVSEPEAAPDQMRAD